MSSDKRNTNATGWERTGEHTFNVTHNDGSIFECKVDDKRKFDLMKGMKGRGGKVYSFNNGLGLKKPLICNICNKRVYKITYENGQNKCDRCK